jgi:arsenate-mycothiol transferase
MAASLMADYIGGAVDVYSAGTSAGTAINPLSAQSLLEVGIDITAEKPKAITAEVVRSVDVVVTTGREAKVDEVAGTRFENRITDEPFERGHRRDRTHAPGPQRHRRPSASPGVRPRRLTI